MAQQQIVGYLQALDPLLLQPQYPIPGEGLSVGRDCEQCQVILSRDFVSRRHCLLSAANGSVQITDLGTTNGTFVNGIKIQCQMLRDGDVISLGKAGVRHFSYSRQRGSSRREFILEPQPVYTIGRDADCHLSLCADPTVSSQHARLVARAGGELQIEDLGSANGTFVNGNQVRRSAITATDVVKIGTTEHHFSLAPDGLHVTSNESRNDLRLQALNLVQRYGKAVLLKGINLVIEPGEYIGVLGPSGAGKSTLLNALCGFNPAKDGEVLLNGASLYRCFDMFRNAIGYVPQDDIIHTDLSVENSLFYTAKMRLPRDFTDTQIEQQVTSVIETLGLAHVRKNPVGRLSGGQRKRVSIGCELLTRPSVLFLDEPTSGLDPATEEKLMRYFGQLASQGQSIVVTTHILYNLDLLSLVVILARGRLVYFGPVSDVCAFFSSPQRAVSRAVEIFDVLEAEGSADTSARERLAESFEAKYRQSAYYQKFVVERATVPPQKDKAPEIKTSPAAPASAPPGHATPAQFSSRPPRSIKKILTAPFDLYQLWILLRRCFDLKLSSYNRLLVPLLTPVILAVLTGTIKVEKQATKDGERREYEQKNAAALTMLDLNPTPVISRQAYLAMKYEGPPALAIPLSLPLMLTLTAVFLGTLSACLEISSERSIYMRERSVNLKIPIYVAAKLPYLFMQTLVQCSLYVLLAATMLHLWHVNVLELVLIATGVAWGSCLVGLFISSLDPTSGQNSVILAVVAVLPQLLLSGAMAPGFYRVDGMSAPTKVLACILPARWGYEMMLNVLYKSPEWAQKIIAGDGTGHMGFQFNSSVFPHNALALGLIALGFFIAACVSLKRYDRL
jgi:ABC-type multidrug transport system ATPase subunit/pSer/pThr/pTyr-binding forkhead associated (FHA) protein